MSNTEQVDTDLQDAIAAWAEAHGFTKEGAVCADWYLIGTSQWFDMPDRTLYWHGFRGGSQPPHITAGLLRYATIANDRDIWDGND